METWKTKYYHTSGIGEKLGEKMQDALGNSGYKSVKKMNKRARLLQNIILWKYVTYKDVSAHTADTKPGEKIGDFL